MSTSTEILSSTNSNDFVDIYAERMALREAIAEPTGEYMGMLLELEDEDFRYPIHRALLARLRAHVSAGVYGGLATLGKTLQELRRQFGEDAEELCSDLSWLHLLPPSPPCQHEATIRYVRTLRRKADGFLRGQEFVGTIANTPASLVAGELTKVSEDLGGLASDLDQVVAMAKMEDVAPNVVEAIFNPSMAPKVFPTGIRAIDQLTGGIGQGLYHIVGARPSVGKTAFAKSIVLSAIEHGKSCYVVLGEGNRHTFTCGLIAQMTGISFSKLLHSNVTNEEKRRVKDAALILSQAKIEIADNDRLAPKTIANRAKRIKDSVGLDLVVVDYLQRLQMPPAETRERQVAEASWNFATLSKATGVACVVLCQLNREIGSREDKIPKMTDLRESGSLEQDADVVFLLHRAAALDTKADPRQALVNIGKNRHGPTGIVDIEFVPHTTRFMDKVE